MLPTLNGRIQTRHLPAGHLVGVLWTLVITPILPGDPDYQTTFIILLAVVAVLGVLWELIYHGIQQFRWEKDWPTLFGFITCVNEGLLVWILLKADVVPGVDGVPQVSRRSSSTSWSSGWSIWLVANGPMRVPFIHWRFFGGRIV